MVHQYNIICRTHICAARQEEKGKMRVTHIIVFANEKGGTGKSTTAVHVAIAIATKGASVACLDLDSRQRTLYRYLENREQTMQRRGIDLPLPSYDVVEGGDTDAFGRKMAEIGEGMDFLLIDTPGRDDPLARHAAAKAQTLVTPINDSFVDFDLIGQVDPEDFSVKKLSFYSELIWETRMARAKTGAAPIDWVVLRNRLTVMEARNQQRMADALAQLSKRAGFRVISGLSERVIYRELFPSGLTLLDKGHLGQLGTSHLAARQELRELLSDLALPIDSRPKSKAA